MIRVIFVDDDEFILNATRRVMHSMRSEWEMEFMLSAGAALATLAKKHADVIVSDMRMPEMDGWQLLAEVRSKYPHMARFVLSGQANPGAIVQLVGTAHQFMAKPGETLALKTAIAQTQLLRNLLGCDRLARLVGGVTTLPGCPRVFEELSVCLRKPNASLLEAARIIDRDVAMTANIMKLVNSAFFGARRSISSVERAIAYLGVDTVSALVLGQDVFQARSSTRGSAAADRLWDHSLTTAMTARTIAGIERLPATQIEEAFLAGMLHDVGKIILTQLEVISAEETIVEGMGRHAEAGAYLLSLWGFPCHIVSAVALHHAPRERPDTGLGLTAIVHIADRIARWEGADSASAGELGIAPGLLEQIGVQDRLSIWLAAQRCANREQMAS